MLYHNTASSAREFADAGRLEDWIHTYLTSDGHNQPFSEGLKLTKRFYISPVNMPLSLFERCCGPEPGMKWVVDAAGFENKVVGLMDAMQSGSDIPPIIVHYYIEDGVPAFELNDGNHRYEACIRLGITEFPAIVWITEEEEYRQYQKDYEKYVR